jgi:formiminoglutamase
MNPVAVTTGSSPVILGQPHGGTHLPPELAERLNERGRDLADTDWHIHQLYDGLLPEATVVQATFSRYVIDANRDPSGVSLYPGQNTTGLCSTVEFEGEPIYRDGTEPDEAEIEQRRQTYHAAYDAALAEQIERVRKQHGIALLFDCHSIRSRLPFLFEGQLPDFNLGTNNGTTCALEIEQAALAVCSAAEGFTSVLNGRFKAAGALGITAILSTAFTPSNSNCRKSLTWRKSRRGPIDGIVRVLSGPTSNHS